VLAEIGDKLGKHTKVRDVHSGDIADMHRRITESGRPLRANRILAICSKAFSLALVPRGQERRCPLVSLAVVRPNMIAATRDLGAIGRYFET
jgi:hypothetical protein